MFRTKNIEEEHYRMKNIKMDCIKNYIQLPDSQLTVLQCLERKC